MSQELDELKTGIKDLDDDLRELFAICKDKKKLGTIKQTIDNKDVSSEEFSKLVPEVLIKLSFTLAGPQFVVLLDQINEETVGIVEEAKSLIDEHFGNLFENKNVLSMIKSEVAEERMHDESLADERIHGIAHYLVWEDDPPELTPAVHIAFQNRKSYSSVSGEQRHSITRSTCLVQQPVPMVA